MARYVGSAGVVRSFIMAGLAVLALTACSSSKPSEGPGAAASSTPTAMVTNSPPPTAAEVRPLPTPTPMPSLRGRIVFQSDRDGGFDLYVMNVDGSGITQLVEGRAGVPPSLRLRKDQPSVSRDGTKVAYISHAGGEGGIYVVNADGSGIRLVFSQADLLPGIASPAFSPDGRELAFSARGDIYILDLTTGQFRNLTNDGRSNQHPSWSPDGLRFAFASARGGDAGIYVMNRDGSAISRVARGGGPDWSPDGGRIVYTSGEDIFVVRPDGSGQSQLTVAAGRDISPDWSPDGSMIVFDSDRDGNEEIYVMNADGSGQRRLTTSPSFDVNPAW